jgi:hypothetical protein
VSGAEDVDVVGIVVVVVVVGDDIVVDCVDCDGYADCRYYDDVDPDSADSDYVRACDFGAN